MKVFNTTLRISTPPANEPIDLVTAKKYCRVYSDYEDDMITNLISVARIMVEEYLARALVRQTLVWTVKFDHKDRRPYGLGSVGMAGIWGEGWGMVDRTDSLELARCPVQEVTSVVVRDHSASDVTLDASTYSLDRELDPARLCIYWHSVEQMDSPPIFPIQHIQITFVAGYPDGSLPTPITQAILLMVNYLFERRGDEMNMPDMPKAVFYLLDQFKVTFFGGTP